jgi:hypothetical protein
MKTKHIILGLICVALFSSCSTVKFLPTSGELDVNNHGAYITVRRRGSIVKGELIAIDSAQMVVLTKNRKTKSTTLIPLDKIRHYHITYANPKRYPWMPLLTLSTLSHGVWLLITAPINLYATIAISISAKRDFQYSEKEMPLDKLPMFARFPQGIPPNVAPSQIK